MMTTLPPRPFSGARWLVRATLAVLALLTIVAFATFDSRSVDVGKATAEFLAGFQRLLLEPRLENVTFVELLEQLAITVALGALTTLIGAAVAFVAALGVARNLAPRWLSLVINSVTALVRAVPTVLWVLLFAVSAGLGSVAAVIGMSFHSAGYLIKAYAESFEEIERGTLEALEASGATWWQIVAQAVVPSSVTALLSWTFVRFEINFSTAIAMGAAAGAGGIGFDMFMASGFYLDLRELGAFTYAVLAFAIALEWFATRTTARIHLPG